jgi:hypothetical protein
MWKFVEVSAPLLALSKGPIAEAWEATRPIFDHQPWKGDRHSLPHHIADGCHLSPNR